MKLITSTKTEKYQEIEIESCFLWLKWKTKYRKYGSSILRYKDLNRFYKVGLSEYIEVYELFDVVH